MNRSYSLFSRVELVFWNLLIQVLSQSQVARSFLRRSVRIASYTEAAALVLLLSVSGVVGLISGYLFYILPSSLR
jgi:hypothetical protein